MAAREKTKLESHKHEAIQASAEVQKLRVKISKLRRNLASHKLRLIAKDAHMKKLRQSQKAAAEAVALKAKLRKQQVEIATLKRLLAEYADLRDWKRSAEKARVIIDTVVAKRASRYLHDLSDVAEP